MARSRSVPVLSIVAAASAGFAEDAPASLATSSRFRSSLAWCAKTT
ncbi:MAG: hypothetical protein IPK20_12455 [Betaproteobacteria bacterium]|nr:hypothetical protein [Betaproteobacteria bacterium]